MYGSVSQNFRSALLLRYIANHSPLHSENPADEVVSDLVCSCPGGLYYSTLAASQQGGGGGCDFTTVTPVSIPSAALIPSSTPSPAPAAPSPSTDGPENSPGADPTYLGGDLRIGPTTDLISANIGPSPTPPINVGSGVKPTGPYHDNT